MNQREITLIYENILKVFNKSLDRAKLEFFKDEIEKENILFKNSKDAINIILFLNQHKMWKTFIPILLVKNENGFIKTKASFGNVFNNFSKYKLSSDLSTHYKSGNLDEIDYAAVLFNISFLIYKVIKENSINQKFLTESYFVIENKKSHEIISELNIGDFNNKNNSIFQSIR